MGTNLQVGNQLRHQAGPARLVARAHPAGGIAVEILVEEHQVFEIRVGVV